VDWIDLVHNMDKKLVLVNNSNEPSYFIACRDFVTSSRTISFSRTPVHTIKFYTWFSFSCKIQSCCEVPHLNGSIAMTSEDEPARS
jgi:hypothetical protein